jgi:CheY-like chemotaxis protein
MPTILYIDDVPQALAIRKSTLESQGYDVLTASDGLSGIEMACSHHVDVVLLDYEMPGMMGDEIASILKREHPQVPIIVLTGHARDVPEMLLRISDECVEKGEGPAALLDAVEQALKFPPKPMHPPNRERKAG